MTQIVKIYVAGKRFSTEIGVMEFVETPLRAARRRVAEAERHVEMQQRVIDDLSYLGLDTMAAQALLHQFEAVLRREHQRLAELRGRNPLVAVVAGGVNPTRRAPIKRPPPKRG